jgi:hypothetical protein
LVLTAVAFGLATLAEGIRYGLLLRNRSVLIDPWVLRGSDWAVLAASLLALLAALLTAVTVAAWLAVARSAAYAAGGESDPRPSWMLLVGCLLPVVNLVAPGVFLMEYVRRHRPLAERAVWVWWGAWLLSAAMAVGALLFRTTESLQSRANGVLFTTETNAVALVVALCTLWLLHQLEGRDIRGRAQTAKRWVIAIGPARPVIAEVPKTPETPAAKDNSAENQSSATDAEGIAHAGVAA